MSTPSRGKQVSYKNTTIHRCDANFFIGKYCNNLYGEGLSRDLRLCQANFCCGMWKTDYFDYNIHQSFLYFLCYINSTIAISIAQNFSLPLSFAQVSLKNAVRTIHTKTTYIIFEVQSTSVSSIPIISASSAMNQRNSHLHVSLY